MESIIFFDGECAFCSRSVMLIYRLDRIGKIKFAPLTGQTARNLLPKGSSGPSSPGSIIFLRNDILYDRSAAVQKILEDLGFPYKLLAIWMRLVPKAMADGLYDIVAKNRHRILPDQCIIPPRGKEIERFLP